MRKDEDLVVNRMDNSVSKPAIATAIPLRRYKYGEFTLTVLGDVESPDEIDYRYILAVVRGDDPEPGLYITAEQGAGESMAMRIMMRDGDVVIGQSDQWRELDGFVDESIKIVSQVLSLSDETPYQLM